MRLYLFFLHSSGVRSLIWWSNLTFKWSNLTLGWSDLAMVRSNCNLITDMVRLLLSLVAQTARVYLCFPLGAHVWWGYWSTRGYPPPLPGWMETYPSPLGEGILTHPKWRENYATQLKGDLSPPSRWWETLQELNILLNNSTQWPTMSSNLDPSPEVHHTKYTTFTSPTLKDKKNILA